MSDKTIKNGLYEEYYPVSIFEKLTGKKTLRLRETYKDGKLDPLWGKFDEEGNLKPKEDWN